MKWVRSHIRASVWFALFALAIQFVVLPSHFHRFALGSVVDSAVALASAEGIGGHDITPVNPAPPATEYCAFCAVINLAGTALPSVAPSASQPTIVSPLQFRTELSFLAPSSPPRIFRARAPPLA